MTCRSIFPVSNYCPFEIVACFPTPDYTDSDHHFSNSYDKNKPYMLILSLLFPFCRLASEASCSVIQSGNFRFPGTPGQTIRNYWTDTSVAS